MDVAKYIGAYNIFLCSFDSLISSLMYAILLQDRSSRPSLTTNNYPSFIAGGKVGAIRVVSAVVSPTFVGGSSSRVRYCEAYEMRGRRL